MATQRKAAGASVRLCALALDVWTLQGHSSRLFSWPKRIAATPLAANDALARADARLLATNPTEESPSDHFCPQNTRLLNRMHSFWPRAPKGEGFPPELMVANREVAHADAQYGDRRRNPIPLVSLKPSSWIGRAGSRLIRLGRSLPVEPDRLESALVSRDRGGTDRR